MNISFTSFFLESEILTRMQKIDGGWKCTECDYVSNKKSNLYNHVEAKHVGGQLISCNYCGKVLKGVNSYSVHVSTNHRK